MKDLKNPQLLEFTKANRDALESTGKELRQQLLFIEEELRLNRLFLEEYKRTFGDLFYRARIGAEIQQPTDVRLRPLIEDYRLPLKSILECLTLIETKLGVDTGRGMDATSDPIGDLDAESEANAPKAPSFDAKAFLDKTRKGSK